MCFNIYIYIQVYISNHHIHLALKPETVQNHITSYYLKNLTNELIHQYSILNLLMDTYKYRYRWRYTTYTIIHRPNIYTCICVCRIDNHTHDNSWYHTKICMCQRLVRFTYPPPSHSSGPPPTLILVYVYYKY